MEKCNETVSFHTTISSQKTKQTDKKTSKQSNLLILNLLIS